MRYLFLFCCLWVGSYGISRAQRIPMTPELEENVRLYNEKINELINKTIPNGFHILQEHRLPMHHDHDLVLNMALQEGNWYHFAFIGDPSSNRIRATLFLEGFGDLIQDKIVVRREHEFWTEFSFVCQQSGMYELRLLQRAEIAKPLAYLVVFQKDIPKLSAANQ